MIGFTEDGWVEDRDFNAGYGVGLHSRPIKRKVARTNLHITYQQKKKLRKRH